jgi:hypothetical protein
MNNARTLWREDSGILSNFTRKLFSIRSLILILAMAAYLVSLKSTALGQGCFAQCQQTLSLCLQTAQSDPLEEARCQDNYDKCAADCM